LVSLEVVLVSRPSPDRARRGLVRSRLLAELTDPRPVPLALVVGPAGCGKSTLLAHYGAAFPGPVGWLRLAPRDAGPAHLVGRLFGAIPGLPPAGPEPEIDDLVTAVGELTTDTLLVIDDLQYIQHSPSEAALEQLLVSALAGLRVAAGGRRMPGFNLSRHEFANLRIIAAEDLRFRAWEVESLLRDVYQEPLPPDDVAALARGVDGWAAGLHLFHLSTRGRPLAERRRAVGALAGRSALTRGYLTRTVLTDLPEDLQKFLVDTCVFDALTAARCDRLLGIADSQHRLERLEQAQAFTTTPDGGRSFEYHAVLRTHLSVMLAEQRGDDEARRWHARAAQILEGEGAMCEAVRAYARAEDWDAVRRTLAEVGAASAADGMEPWQDLMPARELLPAWLVAEDPWLVLTEGRHRLSQGQHEAALAAFRRAESLFETEPGRAICRAARVATSIWLRNQPSSRAHWGGWLRAAIQSHPAVVAAEAEALEGTPGRFVRAAALVLAGDLWQAQRVLEAPAPEDRIVSGMSLRLLQAAVALGGGDRSAVSRLAAIGSDAERASMPWLARLARAAGALDLTAEGRKEARTVVEECDQLEDAWGAAIAAGLLCLAQTLAKTCDPEDLADLVRRSRDLNAGSFEAWAQAMLALACAHTRHPDTELEVQRAEAVARAAGVPGARAMAMVAAALAYGGRSQTDRLVVAAAVAADAGLPWGVVTALAGTEEAPTQPLAAYCFGRFRLEIDGAPVDFSQLRPRVRELLRLLALHADQPVHRDVLIEAFWPEAPAAAATRSLHVALSSLRQALESVVPRGWPALLRRDGDAYVLAVPPECYVDVLAFRTALEEAHRARLRGNQSARLVALRTAVDAYGGELLPEEGPAEWVVRQRDELARQAAEAAAELATAELSGGDSGSAIATAQRCVAIDPCHDRGWRTLIAAYREHGDLAAAERARRDYADVLASLGVAS
jgi:ATP/maltotriose-dependent transcriptional regulator MalT/DNA-binding SARP family transcriptional activator